MKEKLSSRPGWWLPRVVLAGGCLTGLLNGGCEWKTTKDDYDYTPPPGKGVLVVDNLTASDLDVYADGRHQRQVDAGDDEGMELEPRQYSIVLIESDGWRKWTGDVDVLEGRLTILQVRPAQQAEEYDVSITFD